MLGRWRLAVADTGEAEMMASPTAGARQVGGRPVAVNVGGGGGRRWPTQEKGTRQPLLPRARDGRKREGGR
uniref:DUF834 domain-containing protein n=1 Tax=Oryza glumipatula TaxID=40148 RepID=A0A0D9YHF6_9ORYZ